MDDSRFNPFPGLRPFDFGEQHLFFGREGQSEEILHHLRTNHFLTVVGTSGSGKSSLIRAGLLPDLYGGYMAIAGSHWRVAIFRPMDDPIGNMARVLNKPDVLQTERPAEGDQARSDMLLEVTLRRSGLGLVEATRLARLPAQDNLLVVVDQFEELFRFADTANSASQWDDATAFVKLLLEASRQTEVPVYIVITMRSDFIGDCARFPELPEAVTAGMYLIPRMTREQRRRAIEEPVAVGSGAISLRLVNRLLNEVGDNPDQLPILQHALMRTWEHWVDRTRDVRDFEKDPMDFADYEAIGGLQGALSNHADEAYDALPDDRRREIAKRMFQCLTEKGADNREVRRPTAVRRIADVAHASVKDVIDVIEEFHKQGRSFVTIPAQVALRPDSVIDISHESLIRLWVRLKEWVNQESESAHMYRRLSEAAEMHAGGQAGLWRDPELQNALNWKKTERPSAEWAQRYNPNFEQVMAFLDASLKARAAEEAEKERRRSEELRRTRRNLVVVSAFSVIAFGLAAFGWIERVIARHETVVAKQATDRAVTGEARADSESSKAERQEQAAIKLATELRIQALRVRDEWLKKNDSQISMLGELIEKSAPNEAAVFRAEKASLLIEQDNLDDAVKEATAAIEVFPDSVYARTSRGYARMLQGRPKEALADFEYIRDKINSKDALNHLNLTIALAQLGRDADTGKALDRAIYYSLHGKDSGGVESAVPLEIKHATGRTAIIYNGEIFHQALYFLRPLLDASWGNKEFASDLLAAEERAREDGIRQGEKEDAALVVLTWARFVERTKSPNYGLAAGQGILWEKAGYPDHAAKHFDEFLKKHAERKEPRYDNLAEWVRNETKQLGSVGSSAREADPADMEVESDLLQTQKKYSQAEKKVTEAIGIERNNVRLYFKRMDIRFDEANEARTVYDDADTKANADDKNINALEKPAPSSQTETAANELEENKAKQAPEEKEKAKQEKLKTLQADRNKQRGTANEAKLKMRQLYQEVIDDCQTVLNLRRDTPQAYYYRAVANYRLEKPQDPIVRDLKHTIDLDPTYRGAMDWLGGPYIKTSPEEAVAWRSRYDRLYPANDWNLWQLAESENKLKQFADAYDTIQRAIAINPIGYPYYKTRAEAEKGLGYPEEQIQQDRADGERAAVEFFRRRADKEAEDLDYANDWERDEWKILSGLGAKPGSEEVRCNAAVTTCVTFGLASDHGERAILGIESVKEVNKDGENRDTRIVQIDRGQNDGVVLGSTGDVLARYSKDEKHERRAAKIGTAEVLSVEPQSALLKVRMSNPKDDGMVYARDCVLLNVRTPKIEPRSELWSVVKYNIALQDRKGQEIADFRMLYSKESPELDGVIYQKLLDEIHEFGRLNGDTVNDGKPISKGMFSARPTKAREVLEGASREDLDRFFQYVQKFPGTFFGHKLTISEIYKNWVLQGMPES